MRSEARRRDRRVFVAETELASVMKYSSRLENVLERRVGLVLARARCKRCRVNFGPTGARGDAPRSNGQEKLVAEPSHKLRDVRRCGHRNRACDCDVVRTTYDRRIPEIHQ